MGGIARKDHVVIVSCNTLNSPASHAQVLAEIDEKTIHSSILTYMPDISFDIKPVLAVDHAIANMKQAAAVKKRKRPEIFIFS